MYVENVLWTFFAFVIFQALKMLKASDVKPYVVFISPPSYDRILTLRRGKVDPFNPQPAAQMSVSVLHPQPTAEIPKCSQQQEQGWRSGENARLPPMWPGFDSRTRRHMWVEFVVGSLLCSERFFSGYSGFPLSSNQHFQIPIRSGMHGHF